MSYCNCCSWVSWWTRVVLLTFRLWLCNLVNSDGGYLSIAVNSKIPKYWYAKVTIVLSWYQTVVRRAHSLDMCEMYCFEKNITLKWIFMQQIISHIMQGQVESKISSYLDTIAKVLPCNNFSVFSQLDTLYYSHDQSKLNLHSIFICFHCFQGFQMSLEL